MSDFEPNPPQETINAIQDKWKEETDTFGRVYSTILGIADLKHCNEIADIAGCSSNAAKKHLDRLADMGIARKNPNPKWARYCRNEAYLEWQEANRIAEHLSTEEIIEEVRQLEIQSSEFEKQYESTDPNSASVYDGDSHKEIHKRMKDISEWQKIEKDIRIYEFARHLAQNEGHFFPSLPNE